MNACIPARAGRAGQAVCEGLRARVQAAEQRLFAEAAAPVGQERGTRAGGGCARSPPEPLRTTPAHGSNAARAPSLSRVARACAAVAPRAQDGDIDFREFIVGLSSWESNERNFGRLRFAFRLLDSVRARAPSEAAAACGALWRCSARRGALCWRNAPTHSGGHARERAPSAGQRQPSGPPRPAARDGLAGRRSRAQPVRRPAARDGRHAHAGAHAAHARMHAARTARRTDARRAVRTSSPRTSPRL